LKPKRIYSVQVAYEIVTPEGCIVDCFSNKKEAIKVCNYANKELEKYYKGFGYKSKSKKEK
jgi:hypothetical protein